MAEKVHLHAGHRERLREQFLSAGTDIFRAHQILEFLLFYSVPRRDTNNLAHALIEHFGSAYRVLAANEHELTAVGGIGAHTAKFFHDYRDFVSGTLEEPCDTQKKEDFNPEATVEKILLEHYKEHTHEHAIMLLINNNFDIFNICTVADFSIHSARFHTKDAVRLALNSHAASVVLAHNHPSGLAVPTNEDLTITKELERHFCLMGINLYNHFLVANGRALGLLHKEADTENPALSLHFSATFSAAAFAQEQGPRADVPAYASSIIHPYSPTQQKLLLARFLSYAMSEDKACEWSKQAFLRHPHLQLICAQPLEWLEASGLSRSGAALLKLAIPSFAACLLKSQHDIPLTDAGSIGSALTLRCMTLTGESIFLLLFDEKMRRISFTRVTEGVVNSAEVSTRRIAEIAHFSHARYAVLAHNHPFGSTAASQNDIFSTYAFMKALEMVNCTLLEHIIVSGNRFSPLLLLLKKEDAPAFAIKNFYSEEFLKEFENL